jgi:class 3 adenylate cyclase
LISSFLWFELKWHIVNQKIMSARLGKSQIAGQMIIGRSPANNRPQELKMSDWRRKAIATTAISFTYLSVALLFKFIFYQIEPTPILPVAGLAVVAVWRYGVSALAGIAIGDVIFNFLHGGRDPAGLLLTVGATAQAFLAAWWWRRSPGQPFIDRPRDALGWFVLATLISTLLNSLLSAGVEILRGETNQIALLNHWLYTWMANGLGILTVTPLLVTFRQALPMFRTQIYEVSLGLFSIFSASWLVFMSDANAPINRYTSAYFLFPLTIWAGLRLGLPGAGVSSFVIASIAFWGTKLGLGPFGTGIQDFNSTMVSVQFFLTAQTIAALILATAEIQMRFVEKQRSNLVRYLHPSLVDRLDERDTTNGLDRRQRVAVLFADIIGFATIIETMTPEATIALLRELHEFMESIVFRSGGILGQYLGESVMAVFGATEVGTSNATNAVACARNLVREVSVFNAKRVVAGKEPILMGIGIDYGIAAMGDIGGQRQMAFTVAGKVPKIATRLKDLCPQFQADIIITKAVQEAIRAEGSVEKALLDEFIPIGEHQLLGLSQPIRLLAYSQSGLVVF